MIVQVRVARGLAARGKYSVCVKTDFRSENRDDVTVHNAGLKIFDAINELLAQAFPVEKKEEQNGK